MYRKCYIFSCMHMGLSTMYKGSKYVGVPYFYQNSLGNSCDLFTLFLYEPKEATPWPYIFPNIFSTVFLTFSLLRLLNFLILFYFYFGVNLHKPEVTCFSLLIKHLPIYPKKFESNCLKLSSFNLRITSIPPQYRKFGDYLFC